MAPHSNKPSSQQTRNCLKIIKNKWKKTYSQVLDGCLTPRQTDRLTSGHNITLTFGFESVWEESQVWGSKIFLGTHGTQTQNKRKKRLHWQGPATNINYRTKPVRTFWCRPPENTVHHSYFVVNMNCCLATAIVCSLLSCRCLWAGVYVILQMKTECLHFRLCCFCGLIWRLLIWLRYLTPWSKFLLE
jgi:hypothetical protein